MLANHTNMLHDPEQQKIEPIMVFLKPQVDWSKTPQITTTLIETSVTIRITEAAKSKKSLKIPNG